MRHFISAFELTVQSSELIAASAVTIGYRGLMASHQPFTGKAVQESQRMVSEKLLVGLDVGIQMQRAALASAMGTINPFQAWQQILDPLRNAAVANACRLSK